MTYEEKVKKYFKDKESQDLVIQWLQGKSEGTREFYIRDLVRFCRYAKKTPKELLEDRTEEHTPKEKETPSEALLRRKSSERLFQRVFTELEKTTLAKKTIGTARAVVKSFYSYINYPLNKTDTPYRKNKERKFKDVELAHSDYGTIVDAGDMKEKLRVVWLAQTGMRLGDVRKLKVKDLTEFDLRALEAVKIPMVIDYLPEKTQGRGIEERYTFLGEYGVKLLRTELENRKEKFGLEVVREQYIFIGQKEKQLHNAQWISMVKSLAKKAHLKLNGEHGRIRPHCFRKYFNSNLTGHNVNKNIVDWFMGHSLKGVEESYFLGQTQRDSLRQIYKGVVQYLTPMKMQVIEKVIVPTGVTEQMAKMCNEITSLRTWKEKFEEEHKNLRKDFDKMMTYLTEAGKKRIFETKRV